MFICISMSYIMGIYKDVSGGLGLSPGVFRGQILAWNFRFKVNPKP